jgi:hypothetical protein
MKGDSMHRFEIVILQDGDRVGGCSFNDDNYDRLQRAMDAAVECEKAWSRLQTEGMDETIRSVKEAQEVG